MILDWDVSPLLTDVEQSCAGYEDLHHALFCSVGCLAPVLPPRPLISQV